MVKTKISLPDIRDQIYRHTERSSAALGPVRTVPRSPLSNSKLIDLRKKLQLHNPKKTIEVSKAAVSPVHTVAILKEGFGARQKRFPVQIDEILLRINASPGPGHYDSK